VIRLAAAWACSLEIERMRAILSGAGQRLTPRTRYAVGDHLREALAAVEEQATIARRVLDKYNARDREQDECNGPACIACRVALYLREESDWPDDGDVLCDACMDRDRTEYLQALREIAAIGRAR